MNELVTIAIPTLNRVDYLRLAVSSALGQTYRNIEVIVSNNASTDQTMNMLSMIIDTRLTVIVQQETIGMMDNWNHCLARATGMYFLLLSDDDILEPNAIEEMLHAYEESDREGKGIGFVWSAATNIDGEGNVIEMKAEPEPPESAESLLRMYFECKHDVRLYPCAILFRTRDLDPGYDLRFPLAADTAQWMRSIIKYGSAKYISAKLVRYRMHHNTTLKTNPSVWCNEYSALKSYVLNQLKARGENIYGLAEDVRYSEKRRNVRLTLGMIKLAYRDRKGRALLEYMKNIRVFRGFFGAVSLAKGILIVIMPRTLECWLRRCLLGNIRNSE